jgi:hypothetical protein
MNAKLVSRIISLLILGIILALGMHFQMEHRRQAGRDAFIAEQERRWERAYTRPHPLPIEIIVCFVAVSLVGAVYELLAAGLCPLIRKLGSNDAR